MIDTWYFLWKFILRCIHLKGNSELKIKFNWRETEQANTTQMGKDIQEEELC